MKTLKVLCEKVYGKEVIRPVCPDAQAFCDLIGQKTLTQRDINQIKRLGYSFELVTGAPQEFNL